LSTYAPRLDLAYPHFITEMASEKAEISAFEVAIVGTGRTSPSSSMMRKLE